jgi:hypothetical protein
LATNYDELFSILPMFLRSKEQIIRVSIAYNAFYTKIFKAIPRFSFVRDLYYTVFGRDTIQRKTWLMADTVGIDWVKDTDETDFLGRLGSQIDWVRVTSGSNWLQSMGGVPNFNEEGEEDYID